MPSNGFRWKTCMEIIFFQWSQLVVYKSSLGAEGPHNYNIFFWECSKRQLYLTLQFQVKFHTKSTHFTQNFPWSFTRKNVFCVYRQSAHSKIVYNIFRIWLGWLSNACWTYLELNENGVLISAQYLMKVFCQWARFYTYKDHFLSSHPRSSNRDRNLEHTEWNFRWKLNFQAFVLHTIGLTSLLCY